MTVCARVEAFLNKSHLSTAPLLLALSGGADSLCLFYCLLAYRDRNGIPFQVAHVDHGWRKESKIEAHTLKSLAAKHEVPFHLKTLDPSEIRGNLEAGCRKERYAFFTALCKQFHLQAILTGHHRNDAAETIFKRILEGAHWSRWPGLKPDHVLYGMRVLRPLLEVTKKEIQQELAQAGHRPFEDPTNHHVQFLRGRLRESLFPRLSEEFGKDIQKSLLEIGKEAGELVSYFESKLGMLLEETISGPWGICLDLQGKLPRALLEIKYLLRLLCLQHAFFLSRAIIEQAAQALYLGLANKTYVMGQHRILIDRQRIFILPSRDSTLEFQEQMVSAGAFLLGPWQVQIAEETYRQEDLFPSWKESWIGKIQFSLPKNKGRIGSYDRKSDQSSLIRRWSNAKVPAFLTPYFPVVKEESGLIHEFLTGKPPFKLRIGEPCWKIILNANHTCDIIKK